MSFFGCESEKRIKQNLEKLEIPQDQGGTDVIMSGLYY